LHHNERNGSFSEVAVLHGDALLVPRVSRGAAFADIDNDGDIDVVINNLDGKPLILRNDGGNQNNWVTLQLLSGHRNHNALGARVKVVAADLVQWDEIRSGGSYLSSSDLRLHFGLEKRSQVNLIEVHWPDGKIETVRDTPVNQFLVIEEGKGLVRSRTVVHYQDAK
jgi:enediyne biosynthesis protein E4